jgi:hypothetical protein
MSIGESFSGRRPFFSVPAKNQASFAYERKNDTDQLKRD